MRCIADSVGYNDVHSKALRYGGVQEWDGVDAGALGNGSLSEDLAVGTSPHTCSMFTTSSCAIPFDVASQALGSRMSQSSICACLMKERHKESFRQFRSLC